MNIIADCWTQVFQGTHPGQRVFRSTNSPRAGAAWTQAFTACRVTLMSAPGPCLQGVTKLERQLPVVLLPEMEGRLAVCLCHTNPFPVQLPQGHPLVAVVQVAANDVQGQSELVLTSPELVVVKVVVPPIRAAKAEDNPALALQGEGLTRDQQDQLATML
ncbi:hypothetical protein MHYP_G00186020 [Metynnis hypsauchen]